MEWITDPANIAIFGIVVAAASEIIGLVPKWKSNSIIQLILGVAQKLVKGGKK